MDTRNIQRSQEMKAMVQNEIRSMFPNLFKQYATQYGVNKTATHSHTGTDSVRIEEVNLVNNIKYNLTLNAQPGGGSDTVLLRAIPNMATISVLGFAANNVSVPATKRAIFNGHAGFGKCFGFDSTGSSATPSSSLIGVQITQSGNSMYVDSTTLANNRVGFSQSNIIYVIDNAGTEVAKATIDSYENGTISMTITLETDWQIFFSVLMS